MSDEYEVWVEGPDGVGPKRTVKRPALQTELALIGVKSYAIKELLDVAKGPAVAIVLPEQYPDRLWIASVNDDHEGGDE
jgi:hypothetical protein